MLSMFYRRAFRALPWDRRCSMLIVAFHTPMVEYVLRLTCFAGYDVNGMASISCDDVCVISCVTCVSTVKTTGLRLSHYCITACVSTCDAWFPHVIYFTSAIRCNSLVLILGGFKHEWRWRSPQDRMDDNRGHHGAMEMEPIVMQKAILFII